MSKTVLLRVTALSVLCLAFTAPSGAFGSCVQFSTQTVRVHVDAEHDRLDLQLIYRDLHSTGANTRGAMEQLAKLRDGERWFAVLSNFPFMVHLEPWLEDPPEPDTPQFAVLSALERHLEVRPGELWVDSADDLCGSQLVRLRELDQFVRELDGLCRDALSQPSTPSALASIGITDPESHALLRDVVARGEPLLMRRGSSFVFRLPVTDLGARQLLGEMWRGLAAIRGELETPGAGDSASTEMSEGLAATLALVVANDWSIASRRGAMEFSLGDPNAATWLLKIPASMADPRSTRADLRPALREAGWEILGPEHEDALAARWRAFLEER